MSSAAYKKTITIGLDYAQFSGGITELNRKMGLLDAEFKLASEQAKNYGTETDKLQVKKETLSQKIDLQNKLVAEHAKQYEKAVSSGKNNEKAVDSMDKKLLNARTTLEKLNGEYESACKELDEYAEQQKKAGKSTENADGKNRTFGDTIRGVSEFLGIRASPAIEAFASKFDNLDESVGLALVTIGGIATKLFDCTKAAAEYADTVLTLSSTTGLSIETLQKMDYAAELLDVSINETSRSMSKMTKSMSDARNGNKELQKSFAQLGVKYKESNGELRNVEDTFYNVIDALGRMSNETERDARSMRIFGESARQLNPLIETGSKRLRELGEEAENLGYVMDESGIRKLGKFDDAMKQLDKTSEGLKNNLGLALAPILTDIFGLFASIPIPVLETMTKLAMTVGTIVVMVKAFNSVTKTGKTVIDFFTGLDAKTIKTTAIIMGVVAAMIAFAAIIAVIMGRGDDVQNTMQGIGNSIGSINSNIAGGQRTRYNARGTDYFEGGETWVGEGGPERVVLPRGSRILSNQESGGYGNQTNIFHVTIDAKNVNDFNDVVRLAQNEQMSYRTGRARG